MADLSGKVFGKLKVLRLVGGRRSRWLCLCECGKTVELQECYLSRGDRKSCGCNWGNKIIDRIGERFGRLTVISMADRMGGKIRWNCLCDCGKEVIVRSGSLQAGNTLSCGCLQKEKTRERARDLTGMKFGRLLVVRRTEQRNHSYHWWCRCECGQELEVSGCNLVTGGSKSCGCLRTEATTKHGLCGNHRAYREYLWKQDPARKLRHYVSNSIRKVLHGAKHGSCFDHLPYSPNELKEHLEAQFESWMSWDNYGGSAECGERTWWIDHVIPQSSFGYTSMIDARFGQCWALSNLRPLEKIDNIKKGARR